MLSSTKVRAFVDGTGLTEGEKEEGAKAKEALNSDGEGSEDEGDTRKAATYGNKKNEACFSCSSHPWTAPSFPIKQHTQPVLVLTCFSMTVLHEAKPHDKLVL